MKWWFVIAAGNVTAANLGGAYYDGDMDNLTTPGIYYAAGSCANLPEAVGSMVWLTASGNIVMQVCIVRQSTADVYTRQRTAGSTWGASASIASSATACA